MSAACRFARRRGSRPVEALRASGRRRARRGRGGPVGLGGRGRRPRRARRRGIALGSRVRRRAWLLAQPRARRFAAGACSRSTVWSSGSPTPSIATWSGRGRSRIWRSWPKRSGGRPTRSSRSRGRCTRTAAIRASSRPAATRAARARRPHRGSLRRRVGIHDRIKHAPVPHRGVRHPPGTAGGPPTVARVSASPEPATVTRSGLSAAEVEQRRAGSGQSHRTPDVAVDRRDRACQHLHPLQRDHHGAGRGGAGVRPSDRRPVRASSW